MGSKRPTALPLGRVLLIWVTAIGLSWVIGKTGALKSLEKKLQDVWAVWAPIDPSFDRVIVVRITEEDYRTLFKSRRPLNPQAIEDVISAITAYKPLMVGVDIDTSDEAFKSLEGLEARSTVPIVWARDTRDDKGTLGVMPALAGRLQEPAGSYTSGLGLITADSQGIARTYQRWFETTQVSQPSFTCALIEQCGTRAKCDGLFPESVQDACRVSGGTPHDDRLIDYRQRFETKPSSPYFSAGELVESVDLPPADRAQWTSTFHDKIVLVGGTFAASGDAAHATPLGLRPGVEIMAQILGTEMRGGGAHLSRPFVTALIAVFEMYLIVLVIRQRGVVRLVWGGTLVLVLAALSSFFTEGHLGRTLYFVVVLGCVLFLVGCVLYVKYSQTVFADACEELARRFQASRFGFSRVAPSSRRPRPRRGSRDVDISD